MAVESRPGEETTEPERSRLRALLPALVIFAGVSVFIGAHVAAYRPLSPFDEPVHFDYVVKASRGEIVNRGERLGQEAMREIACRGIAIHGLVLPSCDRPTFDPDTFPGKAFSTAEIHPPLYYGVTGILARGLVAARVAPDMLTAARLVGILWLGLGLLFTWYAGRELGLAPLPLATAIAAVGAAPSILHASATVTNDVTGLAAGGLLAWVTLRWEKGSSPLWLLGSVAFLAVTLKTTNGLAVALCALYLVLRPRVSGQSQRSNRAGIAVLLGGAAVAAFAWVVIHGLLASSTELPPDAASTAGLTLFNVLYHLITLITPVSYGLPRGLLGDEVFWGIGGFIAVLILGATVAPVLRGSYSERWERLAGSAGIGMLLGGVLFAVLSFFLYGRVTVSPRYGLSMTAILVVSLAAAIRSRPALWGLVVLTAGQLAIVLSALVSA